MDNKNWHFLPIRVIWTGYSRWGEGAKQITRASSNIIGIELITHGDAYFQQDDQEYLLKSGTVFLKRTGSRHSYRTGPSGYLHKRFVRLGGVMLEPWLRSTGLWYKDFLQLDNPAEISFLLKEMALLMSKDVESEDLIKVYSDLSVFAFKLISTLGMLVGRDSPPHVIKELMNYLSANQHWLISKLEIESHMNMPYDHLNHQFQGYFGITILQYFYKQKFALAEQALVSSRVSVQEVAWKFGYNNAGNFSTAFKRFTGKKPRDVLNQSRRNSP